MKNFRCSFSFDQRKRLLPISLAACILLSGAVSASAQSDLSGVSGTITDSSGAVVRGANVTVTDEATGVVHTALTNDSGYYTIPSLSPGRYTISVTAANFQKTTSNGNNLDPNVSTTANLQLTVGSASDVVEVSAQETAIQTESTVLGRVITSKQAEMLPLSGRNPISLALLKAGVTSTSGNVSSFQFSTGLGGLNINGARDRDNLVTYDGAVAVRVRANGDSTGVIDLENVQEVQVLATNYPAEYGRSVGGQVRITTKAGTDKFHGSIYEYLQNPVFNANTWVRNHAANNNDPTIPRSVKSNYVAPFTYNQFGFSVNGPLYIPHVIPKGKVFFLYSEAFVRFPGTDTKPVTVPNPAFRSGDFSSIATHIRDPKAVGTCDPKNGGPACFPGNIIPQDRLSPNGVGLLSIFPAPTPGFLVGTQNLLQIAKHPQTQQIDSGNLDIIPTDKDYIRFRLTHFYYFENNPFSAAYSVVPRVFNRPAQTASLDWVHTFSSNTMNEVLLTVAHSADRLFIDTSSGLYDRTKYGVNYPFLFPDGKDLPNKIPTVSFLSTTAITGMDGSAYPSHSQGATFDYADTFTHIMGNHTLRAGALYERMQYNDYDQISGQNSVPGQTNNQNGKFEFSSANLAGTGLDLADAALGLFSSYAEVGARAETPYRSNMYEFFAQDSWKATPKLHVDFGMRYSIVNPFYSLWNNIGTFDPAFYDPGKAVKIDASGNPIPGTGDPLNGTVLFGNGFTESAKAHVALANTGTANNLFHNLPRGYMDTHYTTFQPRVGLSYAINPKTVLRSGFGRYMSRQGVSDGVFEGGAPPLQSYAGISGGSADNPGGSSQGSFPTISGRVDRKSPQPESYVWNLSVERELPFNTVLGVAYVGRRGLHGQFQANMNQAPVGSAATAKAAGLNINSYRPYAGYGPITMVWQGAGSTYNGLQIDLNHRFQKGMSFGLAYTYAHSNDCGSFQKNFLPNFNDPKFLCGAADYDIRQAFTMNAITAIPFHSGSRFANQILGGWQLSQIYNFQTGVPLSVATGTDIAGVGAGGGAQFYSTVAGVSLGAQGKFSNGSSDQNFWFNPKAFVAPAANSFTPQHTRNILRAPGVMNFNAGLQKKFQTFENQFLTFRFEAFNFPNHPNLSAPDVNPTSSTFGRVTSKTGQRSMQASLRYTF